MRICDFAKIEPSWVEVSFITSCAENAVLRHGHRDPGIHVLTKPFAMEALASRIKDLINTQRS